MERRALFAGAVYAPFIVHELIAGVLDREFRSVSIRIGDSGKVIYDEFGQDQPEYDPNPLGQKTIEISVYGRNWEVDIRTGNTFRSNVSAYEPTAILTIGLLIDLCIFGVFVLLMRVNKRGLRFAEMATTALRTESSSLKLANDELVLARQEAESASAAKTMFLSTMSHEVRTPLTAISGVLVLLERARLPENQKKLVAAGTKASDRLMKLLTNVLDVSRLEAKAVNLWEREVKVYDLIDEWRTLAQGMVECLGKDIVVSAQMDVKTPDTIQIDDIRLSQVMHNLMDNAVRFTKRGEIIIKASVGENAAGSIEKIVFSISDTGFGIEKDDFGVIFERFRQVDGSITRENGGSGLGLTICQDLVKLMGGEIEVTSTPDVGTVFEVTLPVGGIKAEGG